MGETKGQTAAEVEIFGPYEVYDRLGIGGMATVHRAVEKGIAGFQREVALKRLLPELAQDEGFVASFVREAKLASALSHANIVQIFELGRVGPTYFISMEYIPGSDLRRILKQARRGAGPPPLTVVVSLLSELCDALDYAHNRTDDDGEPLGLIHRDISPSNLLVSAGGHLKIIDFGLAKATTVQHRTKSGRLKGKLAYMAPEAVAGAELDPRSDLFSAGVIAHELLTARPLFAARTDFEMLKRIRDAEIEPPSRHNEEVPRELDELVLRALARKREDRFASAAAMRAALEKLAHQYHLHATNRDVVEWTEWASSREGDEPPEQTPSDETSSSSGSISYSERSPELDLSAAPVQSFLENTPASAGGSIDETVPLAGTEGALEDEESAATFPTMPAAGARSGEGEEEEAAATFPTMPAAGARSGEGEEEAAATFRSMPAAGARPGESEGPEQVDDKPTVVQPPDVAARLLRETASAKKTAEQEEQTATEVEASDDPDDADAETTSTAVDPGQSDEERRVTEAEQKAEDAETTSTAVDSGDSDEERRVTETEQKTREQAPAPSGDQGERDRAEPASAAAQADEEDPDYDDGPTLFRPRTNRRVASPITPAGSPVTSRQSVPPIPTAQNPSQRPLVTFANTTDKDRSEGLAGGRDARAPQAHAEPGEAPSTPQPRPGEARDEGKGPVQRPADAPETKRGSRWRAVLGGAAALILSVAAGFSAGLYFHGSNDSDAAPAVLSIQSTPDGLRAKVDGEPVKERTPIEIEIDPGKHQVTLSDDSGLRWEGKVDAESGGRYTLHPVLANGAPDEP